MGTAGTVGLVVTVALAATLIIVTHLAMALLAGDPPKPPPLRIMLLRVRATVFIIAAFVFLTVLSLVRGHWWGLLFLAPASLHVTTLVIRLRKMYH